MFLNAAYVSDYKQDWGKIGYHTIKVKDSAALLLLVFHLLIDFKVYHSQNKELVTSRYIVFKTNLILYIESEYHNACVFYIDMDVIYCGIVHSCDALQINSAYCKSAD